MNSKYIHQFSYHTPLGTKVGENMEEWMLQKRLYRYATLCEGHKVDRWLALLPHRKAAVGSIPGAAGYSGFLPQSQIM